ncbi:MAG: 4Fe-4S binding protein [Candidatus Thermoplasmatota archaeon]|nr:4Fe-4S binding protein [Candidatus Thermoplasmatota archaeon]
MATKSIAKYRIISQIASFIAANLGITFGMTGLVYPFFYCYAAPYACASCPLGLIEHAVSGGKKNFCLLLYVTSFMALIGLVFGRAACGWACPIGAIQDAVSKIAGKFRKNGNGKKWNGEKLLRYAKYAALAYVVIGAVFVVLPTFTDLCPIGVLTGTFPHLALSASSFTPGEFFGIGLFVFGLFVALVLLVGRGWCRYVCPIGAMYAPMNKISILKLEIDKEKCKGCGACAKSCPMGINVPEDGVKNPECIMCGRCVEACKPGCLRM